MNTVPDINELIAKPQSASISDDPAVMYAVCAALATRMNKSNAAQIVQYLQRIPQQEFAAFVIKDALNRDTDLKQVKAVRGWGDDQRQALNLVTAKEQPS